MTDPQKRNYIRRKKYLNESSDKIKATLDRISCSTQESINENQNKRLATEYAQTIEAACWFPHSTLSSDSYRSLMQSKTKELCQALWNLHLSKQNQTERPLPNKNQSSPQQVISNPPNSCKSTLSVSKITSFSKQSGSMDSNMTPKIIESMSSNQSSITPKFNIFDTFERDSSIDKDLFENPLHDTYDRFSFDNDQLVLDTLVDHSLLQANNFFPLN